MEEEKRWPSEGNLIVVQPRSARAARAVVTAVTISPLDGDARASHTRLLRDRKVGGGLCRTF
jgi:hypothetical protein